MGNNQSDRPSIDLNRLPEWVSKCLNEPVLAVVDGATSMGELHGVPTMFMPVVVQMLGTPGPFHLNLAFEPGMASDLFTGGALSFHATSDDPEVAAQALDMLHALHEDSPGDGLLLTSVPPSAEGIEHLGGNK